MQTQTLSHSLPGLPAGEIYTRPFEGQSILVVDDEVVNLLVAERTIEKWNLRVEVAIDGVEAVLKVRTKKYDVILMDIYMRNMDGNEAAKQIRDMGFQSLPIAALTSSSSIPMSDICHDLFDKVIRKPFEHVSLFLTLKNFLEGEPIADK